MPGPPKTIAHGRCGANARETLSLALPRVEGTPLLALPGPHFACLVACDARLVDDAKLIDLLDALLDAGLVYLCAWGPGCARVHDLADRMLVRRELKSGSEHPVMTTWHTDEELEDALCFLLDAASPDEAYAETCGSNLILAIANIEWEGTVSNWLSRSC